MLFIRILISHKNVNALLDFEFFLVCRKKNTHTILGPGFINTYFRFQLLVIMYRIGVFVLTLSVCLSACVAELTICERNPIHTTAEKSKGDNGFQISLLELDSKKNEKFKSSQNYTGNNIFFLVTMP